VPPHRQKITDVFLDDENEDSESNSDEDEGPKDLALADR
jgi:hypothetical protein